MIISRAPFRVSFCGGGSDIPSFYEKYGGCVLSTSIRKYCYLAINKSFNKDSITLKYSKTEIVTDPNKIEHRIFKQVLKDFNIKGIEITSMADIPSGTGLGSSSSFTVALLKLLYTWTEKSVSTYKVAKEACDVEINQLGNPIGKQDQFAAAFGGLRYYEFCPDGFVKVEPIIMKHESYQKLQDNLMMFYTGDVRDANNILAKETKNLASDTDKIESTKKLCEMTRVLKGELENNNVDALGEILDTSWQIKKSLAQGISNPIIDKSYENGIKAGATGGKLLGAGGGGFLLFYVPTEAKREAVRKSLSYLTEMKFELDQAGCSIIFME
ncbi:MAG: GHMP kinase [Bacilli bacterium]|jgi:D-glycero-alpha-D-manno-heptose-7-phosphate kinase|nr:GHMP kinase [Bacilli bacterium]MCH4210413.1 GHMP kinase [Bacilli bacterium]MCH4229034.1 GHMP kinase [Bacilli bacterium]MCH4278248.1 GHMP kinase [Bacilli bacterium]MCI2055039.1 GHMP kinase [Bacilli bacterium]